MHRIEHAWVDVASLIKVPFTISDDVSTPVQIRRQCRGSRRPGCASKIPSEISAQRNVIRT